MGPVIHGYRLETSAIMGLSIVMGYPKNPAIKGYAHDYGNTHMYANAVSNNVSKDHVSDGTLPATC